MALRSATLSATCHGAHRLTSDVRRQFTAHSMSAPRLGCTQPVRSRTRTSSLVVKAERQDNTLEDYVEVKVDSVRVAQGSSVVFLRILDGDGSTLPVHIGESESNSLMKEINNQRNMRPLTHDVAKSMLLKVGYRVSMIRITEIVANTYYARIHLARNQANGDEEHLDVDARPSDAINLAVRFGAPMYVNKHVAQSAAQKHVPSTNTYSAQIESNQDKVKAIRHTLSTFEDPTIMFNLQKELAVQEDRFEEAQVYQDRINHIMTHDPLLRLFVAMESALNDGRIEEAIRLHDEFKLIVATQKATQKNVS